MPCKTRILGVATANENCVGHRVHEVGHTCQASMLNMYEKFTNWGGASYNFEGGF